MSDEIGSPATGDADAVARLLRQRVTAGPDVWLPVEGR